MLLPLSNLADFLTDWYGSPVNETIRLPIVRAPQALLEWHGIASRWDIAKVASVNRCIDLRDLVIGLDGMQVFWQECQGACEWASRVDEDDPMVYVSRGEGWESGEQRMSSFLWFATVLDAIEGAPLSAYVSWISQDEVNEICASLVELDISGPHGFMENERFFAGENLLVRTGAIASGNSGSTSAIRRDTSLTVASLNRKDLDKFTRSSGAVTWRVSDPDEVKGGPWPLPF